jgi:hypothetical protein
MAEVLDSHDSKQSEERKKFYHDISEYLGESIMHGIDFGDKKNSELSSKVLILQAERLPSSKMKELAIKLNLPFINESLFINEIRKKEFELNL